MVRGHRLGRTELALGADADWLGGDTRGRRAAVDGDWASEGEEGISGILNANALMLILVLVEILSECYWLL